MLENSHYPREYLVACAIRDDCGLENGREGEWRFTLAYEA